ncbi:MAG: ABC transporter ATP-binding protein [Myxococcales bacterium]
MGDLYRLFRYLRPYRRLALLAPLLMMTEVALDLLQPRFVQHIIDEGIGRGDSGLVLRSASAMAGSFLLAMLCGGGCTFFAVRAAYRMGGAIRRAVFAQIQSLSFYDLDRFETGTLITRLTSDVNQVQEMVTMLLRGMVRMPLLVLGSVLMASTISPRLSLIFCVILPVLAGTLFAIIRATFPLYRQVQQRLDELHTVLQENLAGVRVVKAFARAPHERERFARKNQALIESMAQAVRTGARTTPAMTFTLNAGIVAALWLGGQQVQVGGMKVGQVVAFINYLVQALNALVLFSNLVVQVSRAQASARRLGELLNKTPSLAYPAAPPAVRIPASRGKVEFEDVSFGYAGPDGPQVLRKVSFRVEPGQTLAILGATGAGKSSLVQLIPRFYDVSRGRVKLDGIDVRDIPRSELHQRVSVALQESILFSASVRENVALGRPQARDEEVVAAAQRSQAHEFVAQRPEGYETLVGQRGVNLSGGQKQRLAIARALLPETPILILDDCTSAIDSATEARIQAALSERLAGQTRIVVTQRVSSAAHADRILVLEDGAIVGDGSHAELAESCAVYQEIHASQIQHGARDVRP